MNQDWYGTALQHPAPQVRERIELIPDAHPEAAPITRWLTERGFIHGTGELRRHVPSTKQAS